VRTGLQVTIALSCLKINVGIRVMAWLFIAAAGMVEIAFVLLLKYSDGLTKLIPSVLCFIATFASIFLLAQGTKHIPIGTAYAVWAGLGSVGVTAVGIVFLQESPSPIRLMCITLIMTGIMGLKVSDVN